MSDHQQSTSSTTDLYRFFGSDDELLYIGISLDPAPLIEALLTSWPDGVFKPETVRRFVERHRDNDRRISCFTVDRYCVTYLGVHPSAVYGADWDRAVPA